MLEDDPHWADRSLAQLQGQSQLHRLAINPIIYAERSLAFSNFEALDAQLTHMALPVLELPKPALFRPVKPSPESGTAEGPNSMC